MGTKQLPPFRPSFFSVCLILFTAVLPLGCSDDDSIESKVSRIRPECLQPIILNALQFQPTNPRASVDKYIYQGEEVFVLSFMNFPDGESAVVSNECEPICSLGGIDGNPSPECSDFNETAQFIENVWTDPR